jgi:hypothetical protein
LVSLCSSLSLSFPCLPCFSFSFAPATFRAKCRWMTELVMYYCS